MISNMTSQIASDLTDLDASDSNVVGGAIFKRRVRRAVVIVEPQPVEPFNYNRTHLLSGDR